MTLFDNVHVKGGRSLSIPISYFTLPMLTPHCGHAGPPYTPLVTFAIIAVPSILTSYIWGFVLSSLLHRVPFIWRLLVNRNK